MIPHTLLTPLRWAALVLIVIGMTVALADRPPVPFPVLLAVIVPASLLMVVVIQRTAQPRVRIETRTNPEVEGKLEEMFRLNEELSRELCESRHMEEHQLLQSKAFDAFLQGVTITDPNRPGNPIVYANEGFTRLTGYTQDEVLGRNCRFLQGKDTSPESIQTIRDAIRDAQPCMVEILNYRKDGTPFWNALSIAPIFDEGNLTHYVGVQSDISAFKAMEVQLRQTQKMDAIGHLAGGVAHDFNNLLTVINGCCELLRTTTQLSPESNMLVDEVHKAGVRAANLTRQLLAFSRRTVLQPRVLQINELVRDFEKLLGRLIGEDIELKTVLQTDAGLVRVDVGQMEQVLMNLVINARDAMPQGGTIQLTSREVYLDEEYIRQNPDLRSGTYVKLSVADTGCGMDKATLGRIFEPFFSTKEVGRGTGLGLAMVYGIVKASGGQVSVESELGKGTSFHILLPSVSAPEQPVAPPSRVCNSKGTETVLLVEDEAGLRSMTRQALESRGYSVLEAENGEAALEICRERRDAIDLILSDVVMPRMGGRELRDCVAHISPTTRIIFTSGYTDDAVLRNGVQQAESDFLQKPFTINALLRKVREVLDRGFESAVEHLGSRA